VEIVIESTKKVECWEFFCAPERNHDLVSERKSLWDAFLLGWFFLGVAVADWHGRGIVGRLDSIIIVVVVGRGTTLVLIIILIA